MSPSRLLTLLTALQVLGCGGDGGDGASELEAVQAVFTQSCSGGSCHVNFLGDPAAELDLSSASLCAEVVDVPSLEANEVLVRPGASNESYLLCKVDPDCARRDPRASLMPLGSEGLGPDELAMIAAWIDGGASGCSVGASAPDFGGLTMATGLSSAIRLEWNTATDDISSSAAIEYLVYQSEASGGQDFSQPTKVVTGVTETTIGGLPISTERFYVVRARDEAGNIDSNTVEVAATTLATADSNPPTFAGVGSLSIVGSSSVEVSWQAASDDVTPPEDIVYSIYVATATGAQNFTAPNLVSEPGAEMALVSGLASDTEIFVVVRASDGIGNEDSNSLERSTTTGSPVSFATDVQPILTARCATAGCHRRPTISAGLDLSAASAHASLVNVDSSQCDPARLRVTPGDESASYLVDKLLDRDLCFGTAMPKMGMLPSAELQIVVDWVGEGALDN